jgi:hypothetical protein
MVVLGLGMGFLMQMTTLVAQNSVEPRDIGVASSSRLFFQRIGGSIGVSAFLKEVPLRGRTTPGEAETPASELVG